MTGVETALLAASLATTVAGGVVSTIGAQRQAKFQAAVAQNNAMIEEQNARRAIERAGIEAQEQDRINAGILGEQISEQSGSGLSARGGSFALGRKSARELARLDTLNVAQQGFLDAFNARTRAEGFRSEASAAKAAGRNALISGAIGTVGSLAGGLAQPTSSGGTLASSLIGGSRSSARRTFRPSAQQLSGPF